MSSLSNLLNDLKILGFKSEQLKVDKPSRIILSSDGTWVKVKVKETQPEDLKTIMGAVRVPLADDAWKDRAAVQDILDDAYGYREEELSAADMNNKACAIFWAKGDKAKARNLLKRALEKEPQEPEKKVIKDNIASLADVVPPPVVPISVARRNSRLKEFAKIPSDIKGKILEGKEFVFSLKDLD